MQGHVLLVLLASTWMCIYIFYLIDIKVFLLYFIFISSISLRLVKYNLICPKPASPLAFSPFRRWDGVGMGHPWSGPALSYIAIPNIKTPTHCLWQRLTVINLAPFISYLHTSYFEHGLYCCNDSLSCSQEYYYQCLICSLFTKKKTKFFFGCLHWSHI